MKETEEIKVMADAKLAQNKINPYVVNLVSILFLTFYATFSRITAMEPLMQITVSVVMVCVNIVINYGVVVYFLQLIRERTAPAISEMFIGLVMHVGKTIVTNIIMGLMVVLYSVLLIVPGIIKFITYIFVNEIMNDNPSLSTFQILKSSKQLTEGYKMYIFSSVVRYLPLFLCGVVPMGYSMATISMGEVAPATFAAMVIGGILLTIAVTKFRTHVACLYVELVKEYKRSYSVTGKKGEKKVVKKTYRDKSK